MFGLYGRMSRSARSPFRFVTTVIRGNDAETLIRDADRRLAHQRTLADECTTIETWRRSSAAAQPHARTLVHLPALQSPSRASIVRADGPMATSNDVSRSERL